jgi:hypothetical protein
MNQATGDLEELKRQVREAADELREKRGEHARADRKVDEEYENTASRPYRETPDTAPVTDSEQAVRAAEQHLAKLLANPALSNEEQRAITGFDHAELGRLNALADDA